MDDLAHDYPLNHRKRKADSDDCNDPSPNVVSTDGESTPAIPSHAPRQPWLASDADDALWSSPTSPQVSSPLSSQAALDHYPPQAHAQKRPRLEKLEMPPRIASRKSSRRSPTKATPVKSPSVRHGSDIEDIGIVPTVEPGPSSGSLLRVRTNSFCTKHSDRAHSIPFDLNSLPIPPLPPLINRQTLKELDLDAILRNPQLRHDLLFDPGLQFRPTGSRRKRDMSEKYWAALTQEIETNCTCISFDLQGKAHPLVCTCGTAPQPPANPIVYQPTATVYTIRMPSRIQPLLSEFLEVLLLVIQPLSSISGIYVNPNTFKAQMQEHSAQATYIRSIFDPALIEQELNHNIFDSSGLFSSIGATLKGHCAPMRDRSVEAMVGAAQAQSSGSAANSSKVAIRAVRMCMEILELMKLDIANHQLQTLRPFLIRTSGQFEFKTLKNRYGPDCSLQATREWLDTAHGAMLNVKPIIHPLYRGGSILYRTLSSNQQLYISVLKGLVDLVFNPPSSNSSLLLTPVNTPPTSPSGPCTSTPLPMFPETLYLDNSRILLMSSDAADATALYMFILLYRQLVFSDNPDSATFAPPRIQDADILRLKRELRDIAGSTRLGSCFSRSDASKVDSNSKEAEKWRVVKQDVVLQVAKRAQDARSQSSSPSSPSSSFSPPSSPVGDGPDERMLSLAQRWADTNMQAGSVLSTMLHRRLQDVVFNAVLVSTYPGRDLTSGSRHVNVGFPVNASSAVWSAVGTVTGMEPFADEIRTLTEKISLLALIHLNAYLPLYEREGFSPSE